MGWQGDTKRITRKDDHILAEMALGRRIKIQGDRFLIRDADETYGVRKALQQGLIEQVQPGRAHFRMTTAGKKRWKELRK